MPIGVGLVPHAVEPNARDCAIVCKKFAQLTVHVIVDVGIKIAAVGTAVVPSGCAAGVVIGIVPIELRVIEK